MFGAETVDGEGDGIAEHGAHDQRPVGGLALSVGHGEPGREVACARHREDLTAVGEDDAVEARDESGDGDQRQQLRPDSRAEDGLQALEERLVGATEGGGAGRHARTEHECEECANDEGQQTQQNAAREVLLGGVGLFGGKGKLFDGEVEPDGEGERGQHASPAEGQEDAVAFGRFDVEGELREIEMGQGADPEDEQDRQGQQGDEDGEAERGFHARDVEADEDGVRGQPPKGGPGGGGAENGAQVAADAHDDDGRCEDVLHVLGQAGDVGAPGPQGRTREGVGAARMRQRSRHLGDAEAEAAVEDGDDDGGDQQAAETAGRDAEVPAEEVPRDDGTDTERPE